MVMLLRFCFTTNLRVNPESWVTLRGVNAAVMARRSIMKMGALVNMASARIDNWGDLMSEGGLTLVNDHGAAVYRQMY